MCTYEVPTGYRHELRGLFIITKLGTANEIRNAGTHTAVAVGAESSAEFARDPYAPGYSSS